MKHIRKSLVCLLLVLLLAAAALTGCTQNETNSTAAKTESQAQTEAPKTEAQTEAPKTEAQTQAPETTAAGTPAEVERQELGEGAKLFYFDVTFSNGETSSYAIHTDAENVGDALVALDLIAGDEGQYGLYVKTIGEETLDYEADGAYWAFYENGEYAMTGVDSTAITEGATYSFVATRD